MKYQKKQLIIIIASVLFLFVISGAIISYFSGLKKVFKGFAISDGEQTLAMLEARRLDGQLVYQDYINLRPVAVVIDNNWEARPAVGLEQASIIYEAVAEGGVTRYLAIFDPRELPEKIGPVRSARPYFIDWASEWAAILYHCGGSPEALEKLRTGIVGHVNEYSADGIYFWRDSDRAAPYNLFTSDKLIEKSFAKKEIERGGTFEPWLYKTQNSTEIDVEDVVVDAFGFGYQVRYRYRADENIYERYLDDEPHVLANGELLIANNIVVQHVEHEVLDKVGRNWVKVRGRGAAEIYQDGKEIFGYWENTEGRTRFFDERVEEIRFNPGVIWVEVVFD